MSFDQSAYPEYLWNPEQAHEVGACPDPRNCDNGHPRMMEDEK